MKSLGVILKRLFRTFSLGNVNGDSADGHDAAGGVAHRKLDGAKLPFSNHFFKLKRRAGGDDLPIDFFETARGFRRVHFRLAAAEGVPARSPAGLVPGAVDE